jgi:hypothetical protein
MGKAMLMPIAGESSGVADEWAQHPAGIQVVMP